MADRDKKAVNCDIALISVLIGHGDAGKLAITVQGGYAAIEHELDIVLGFERLDELCFTAEGVSAVDKIHPAACVGKEHCVLKRGVSAAVHGNGTTLVKRTVTHSAEANACADKLLLTLNTEHAGFRAGGDDYGLCLKLAAKLGLYTLYTAVKLDLGDLVELHLRTLVHDLLHKPVGKLGAGDRLYRREVFHLGRPCYLPAEGAFFDYHCGFARSQGIEGGS